MDGPQRNIIVTNYKLKKIRTIGDDSDADDKFPDMTKKFSLKSLL